MNTLKCCLSCNSQTDPQDEFEFFYGFRKEVKVLPTSTSTVKITTYQIEGSEKVVLCPACLLRHGAHTDRRNGRIMLASGVFLTLVSIPLAITSTFPINLMMYVSFPVGLMIAYGGFTYLKTAKRYLQLVAGENVEEIRKSIAERSSVFIDLGDRRAIELRRQGVIDVLKQKGVRGKPAFFSRREYKSLDRPIGKWPKDHMEKRLKEFFQLSSVTFTSLEGENRFEGEAQGADGKQYTFEAEQDPVAREMWVRTTDKSGKVRAIALKEP